MPNDCGCGRGPKKCITKAKLKKKGGCGECGGMENKNSLVELNMNGTGFPEDLAYMGIDMSPLEGAGVPHKSYEAWYDKTQHENRQRKMDMVKRRAAQRTVKILPYTERPALLSDTFKVNAGRDIHGQIQGGRNLSTWATDHPAVKPLFDILWATGDYSGERAGDFLRGYYDRCDPGEEGILVNAVFSKLEAWWKQHGRKNSPSHEEMVKMVDDVLRETNCPRKAGKGNGGRNLATVDHPAVKQLFDILWATGDYAGEKTGNWLTGYYDRCDPGEEGTLVNAVYSKLLDWWSKNGIHKSGGSPNSPSHEEMVKMVDDVLREKNCPRKAGKGKGKKPRIHSGIPPALQTTDRKAERAVKRMAKAARQALKKAKAGTLQGGDWFSPSTWSWESVNPVNWSTEDWSNLGKGVDAAVFGALSQPEVLGAADAALTAGGGLTIPGVGHVAGKVLGQLLVGAVLAHEYVYPSCEKGEGVLGCNEYRKEVDEVIRAGLDIYKKVEGAEKAVEGLTNWLDTTGMIEAGDVLGSGAYRGAFTRGDQPVGDEKEDFYYPATAQREARGVAEAGGEYAGPQVAPQVAPQAMTLSRVQAF